MDPTSHHAFSRQLACMAGHAYPHPTPQQQQGADTLGMMDNPKMGPMMRALTEDDALMAQHQQQMAIAQGMYQQNSYPPHQMHHPFSPGRNPSSMTFYPQAHSTEYAAAIQGGGYGISPAGYYQRQIPTPSPVMGGGSLGSPNGQQASSYPRSASAGPTIPSSIMMQGSGVYPNPAAMYGVLSTSPQSLPPRNMRSPAALQSPKSLPTSSPVPFSCSSPPAVSSGVYGHNPSPAASDRQQFPAIPKSPGMGRTFQYSSYANPQGPIHPMSAAPRNRPMDQTDGVRSPPFVELVHSKSPPSPLDKNRVDHHQRVAERRNGNTPQRSEKRTDDQGGSLPRLEEMVAFLGEPVLNSAQTTEGPSVENQEMEALMRGSIPDIDGGNITGNVSQQDRPADDKPRPFGGCQQQGLPTPETSQHRTQMVAVKPSPLVVLPPRNGNKAVPQPDQKTFMNHSMEEIPACQQETLGNDGTGDDKEPMGVVLNNGCSEPSAPPSPLQVEQEAKIAPGRGREREGEETQRRDETPAAASGGFSLPDGGVASTERQEEEDDRTLKPSGQHCSESGTALGSDPLNSSGMINGPPSLDRSGSLADGVDQGGEKCSQGDNSNLEPLAYGYEEQKSQHVGGNRLDEALYEDGVSISHSVNNADESDDRGSLEEDVAEGDVRGRSTDNNSPWISSLTHDNSEGNRSCSAVQAQTMEIWNTADSIENDRHVGIPTLGEAKRVVAADETKTNCSNDEGDSLDREGSLREEFQQGRKCEVRLTKNLSLLSPVCVGSVEKSPPSELEQSVTVNSEPQSVVRLEAEEATEEGSSPSEEASITKDNSDTVVASQDQAGEVAKPKENCLIGATPVAKGQSRPLIVSPKGLNSVPRIIAKKSTPDKTEGTDQVAGERIVQGKPFILKVNPAGQNLRTPTSGAGQTQPPVVLVATGESKLKMNAASVVITPLRAPNAKASSADGSKKRPTEGTSPGDQPSPCKKRSVGNSPGRRSTPKKDHSTPEARLKDQSSSTSRKRPVTDSPSRDSLGDPSENPSGDQSTLPLKKRRGRPSGSKTKNRAKRGENVSKGGGRKGRTSKHGSEEEEELSKFRHVQSVKKVPRRSVSPSRGPLLRVNGNLEDVLSCKVINSSSESTAGPSKNRRVSRVLSIPSSVTAKGPTSDASSVTVHPKGKWVCSFCGKQSFFGALGFLYGPYYPTGLQSDHARNIEKSTPKTTGTEARAPLDNKKMPSKSPPAKKRDRRPLKTYPGKTKNGPTFLSESPPPRNVKVIKIHPSGSRGESSRSSQSHGSGPTSPRSKNMELEREEVWVHQDCLIWSQGVFAVGGTLYGLHAAVKEAMTMVCTRCHGTGATLGCRTKGCTKAFHYLCAIEVGCLLHEDNFSMTCPQHKNKKLRMREDPT